uniref:Plac8 onzin related protein 3 n=1 Tax=Neogobius melanostomus TaxID=47308 RepID=A0A8C6WPU2_9GOBI
MSAKMADTQPKPFISTTIPNQWSSGICDCFEDVPMCCFAFWCIPCFTCKTSMDAGECMCLPLLDAFGLIPPMTTAMRVSVRRRYGIEGNICQDCVYSCCCGPCTWCQVARELKHSVLPVHSMTSEVIFQ